MTIRVMIMVVMKDVLMATPLIIPTRNVYIVIQFGHLMVLDVKIVILFGSFI